MKTLITEFISLDGVVQAPGGVKEDTDGGFRHGGWSMRDFDPEVMGGTYAELARQSDAVGTSTCTAAPRWCARCCPRTSWTNCYSPLSRSCSAAERPSSLRAARR